MMLPTIHINGTARNTLTHDTAEALQSLRTARAAMRDAAPNARDYYPQGDKAVKRASADYELRLSAINALISYYESLLEHVAEG